MPNPSGDAIPSVTQEQPANHAASTGDNRQPNLPTAMDRTVPKAATLTEAHEPRPDSNVVLGTFARYELLQEVAVGGMGVVYRARDTSLGRIVALKMIRSGNLARDAEVLRFHLEAKAAANLRHPHIIEIYEIGQHNGHHYFTMAYAEGGSLDKHLDRFAGDRKAATLVVKIARAVQHAHEHGILHRDLKPANVLLDAGDEPRVCDFGLAKLADCDVELTQTGQFVGTPAYMAPEQAVSRSAGITAAADIWALGVLLYQLLTGRRPFAGKERDELLRQIRTSAPPDPSSIRPGMDRSLEAIVLKCLAKDPARRYASAELLADDLGRWLAGEPTRERPASVLRTWGKKIARKPWASTGIVLATVAIGVFAVIGIHELTEAREPAAPPPLVLIDEHGANEPLNWIIGGNYAEITGDADAPLSFKTTHLSMAQLLDRVPWESYRVEAVLRHDAATEPSSVGLFVAHAPPSDPALPRSFIDIGFGDRGPRTGVIQPSLGRIDNRDAWSVEGALLPRALSFASAERTNQPSPTRKLELEVTPETIQVYFEDENIAEMSRDAIESQAKHLYEGFPGVSWRFSPQDGLGVYVMQGRGTIRSLIVRPHKQAHLK